MDPMLESFITESRENLEVISNCFLSLENNPDDNALMDELFRAVHTMKGSSGLFEIQAFTKVVHAAEDVLDQIRSGQLKLTSEQVDTFLDSMDLVSMWLDALEHHNALPEDAELIGKDVALKLRAFIAQGEPIEPIAGPTGSVMRQLIKAPDWVYRLAHEARLAVYRELTQQGTDLIALTYEVEPSCFFNAEDPINSIMSCPGLVAYEVFPLAQPEADFDPFSCHLRIEAIVTADEFVLADYFKYVIEQVEFASLSREALAFAEGDWIQTDAYKLFIDDVNFSALNQEWEKLRKQTTAMFEIAPPSVFHRTALEWLAFIAQGHQPNTNTIKSLLHSFSTGETIQQQIQLSALSPLPDMDEFKESVGAEFSDNARDILLSQKQVLALHPNPSVGLLQSISTIVSRIYEHFGQSLPQPLSDVSEANKQECVHILESILTEPSSQTATPVATQEKAAEPSSEKTSEKAPEKSSANKTLRVEQGKIDTLMDLVGELVVAKNALPFLAKKAEEEFGVKALAKEIQSQYSVINRLSDEMQSAMMQVRMVPLASVFQRFPRLVRDLSRKLDKNIALHMEGEETEADKNVVEELADPLIHLVRNSLDHGLETKEERSQAGKPEQGNIWLRAIPQDDQVLIEITDDGRGIDPNVIKQKAYEKGVISEERLESITDQEALMLIFAAGFSTAAEISDISGRGVGMDVVRTVIQDAGGNVAVDSELGQGTTIRLSLPLSMAVTRIMMIEVNDQSYGVNMQHIVETVKIPVSDVHKIKHQETLVLRGRVIPLFHLKELFGQPIQYENIDEYSVLVILHQGQEVGIVIDAFHEGIDTIQKPLEGIMANYPYYAGTALLGDGRVLLVLDTQELLACQ